MSNLRKQIRISDDPEVTLERIDEPRRGTVFFNGPILAVRGAETYAARKLDKLSDLTERKAEIMSLWEAAKTVAKPMVDEASRSSKFWTGEGFTPELRAKLLREAAAIIKDYYEQEY